MKTVSDCIKDQILLETRWDHAIIMGRKVTLSWLHLLNTAPRIINRLVNFMVAFWLVTGAQHSIKVKNKTRRYDPHQLALKSRFGVCWRNKLPFIVKVGLFPGSGVQTQVRRIGTFSSDHLLRMPSHNIYFPTRDAPMCFSFWTALIGGVKIKSLTSGKKSFRYKPQEARWGQLS